MADLPAPDRRHARLLTAALVTGPDPGLVTELVALQDRAFPRQMQFQNPRQYYADALQDVRNLNIVLRVPGEEVIGYLLALPQTSVVAELRRWDPALRDDPDALYVDIIQTLPGRRHYAGFISLVRSLCREARHRGYRRLTMHARIGNGLSDLTLKLFPDSCRRRRLEDWFGSGEPFDFIEAAPRLRRD